MFKTKLCLLKKEEEKNAHEHENLKERKKRHVQYFSKILDLMFFLFTKKNWVSDGVFFTEASLNLSALQKKFVDEIYQ